MGASLAACLANVFIGRTSALLPHRMGPWPITPGSG